MKKYRCLFLLLTLLFFTEAMGKQTVSRDVQIKTDSLSIPDFNNLINKQFSNLITGHSANALGGYASLDFEKGNVNFAPNYLFRNGNILSLTAIGGISDGFFEMFNHSELNTNLSFQFQYNLINRKQKRKLEYDPLEYKDFLETQRQILQKYSKDSLEIKNNNPLFTTSDSLSFSERMFRLNKKRAEDLTKSSLINLHIKGFQFGWFSYGYKLCHDAFRTFDPTLPFSEQIQKEKIISHEFKAQYSFYRWSAEKFRTFFVSAAMMYDYQSNFEDLNSLEISEVTQYGLHVGDRTTTKKYTAYQGDLIKREHVGRASVDFYYFLFTNKTMGLHLNPTVRFKERQDPLSNLNLGLIIPFKDPKKERSVLNAEVYYCLYDLFNSAKTNLNLAERNSIGLRFAFPIDF